MKQTKHLRQTLWRPLLCLTAFVMCTVSAWSSNFNEGSTLYFKISNTDWKSANAFFAANFNMGTTSSGNRVKLEHLNGDYYSCTVPGSYSHVELLRMNPNEAITANAWNYSNNFGEAPSSDNNCLELADTGWSNIDLKWSTYSGSVSDLKYDLWLMRSRDWDNPEKLELGADGKYTLTRDMNANGEFGIRVVEKGKDGKNGNNQKFWYATAATVTEGTNTYPLAKVNGTNIKLPNQGGNYTFVITIDSEGLPVDITITTPEIEVRQPELYIGGSWISGQSEDLKGKTVRVTSANGKYNDFVITTTKAEKFRFYSKSAADGLGNWMGPDGGADITFTDAQLDGSATFTTAGNSQIYNLPKAGTYTLKVASYDGDKKVSFTISYVEPEKHLYLGASFKGNTEDPNFILEKDKTGKYPVVKFTKYATADDALFRFANAFDRNYWIGPKGDTPIELSGSESGIYTTESSYSYQVYKVKNAGEYELQVTNWDGAFTVEFTIRRTGEAPKNPFYYVGDLNDWFSTEFEDPAGGMSMEKYMAERESWQFRDVTAADVAAGVPEAVEEDWADWYVFDKFPGNQLSGQFQITSGGNVHIWNNADVYGNGVGVTTSNLAADDSKLLKEYSMTPITDDMIVNALPFGPENMQMRSNTESTFPNFHKECNAVEDAKLYFKPGTTGEGGTANMVLTGKPRRYYVFYANTAGGENPDETVQARINTGKPNTKNYFLPGIDYDGFIIPYYTKDDNDNIVSDKPHMNIGDGVELIKLEHFKSDDPETYTYLTGLGMEDDVARDLANEGKLPNGRLVNSFEHLYVTRVPKGFENPAGWKYTLNLTKALNGDDKKKSVVIACNHVYFMPTINGVSIHLNDDELKKHSWKDPETGETVSMDDYDVQYYYRIYYSTAVSTRDNKYSIMVVKHRPGNVTEKDQEIYTSGQHTRRPTLEEPAGSNQRDYGWKPLNAHVSPAEVNATITEEQWAKGEKGWDIEDGNVSGVVDKDTKWHICWVNSTDRERRQRIPKEYSNAYVQILACYYKRDNASNPMRSKVARAADDEDYNTSLIETVKAPDVATAIATADRVSIEPGSLTFENDVFHHPLQGNHLYYVMDNNYAVWTGIDEIENDMIVDEDVAESNAAPVYYNLQGVRVAEPVNGIFIEVKGNRSRKVIR